MGRGNMSAFWLCCCCCQSHKRYKDFERRSLAFFGRRLLVFPRPIAGFQRLISCREIKICQSVSSLKIMVSFRKSIEMDYPPSVGKCRH